MGGGTHKERKPSRRNGESPTTSPKLGRVPPHNIDAEQSLLGGIFLDQDAPLKDLAAICSAADFYVSKHRKIFAAMLSLLEDGFPVDRVSVAERLTASGELEDVGGTNYLDVLDKVVPHTANLAYYAKIVHEKARARRLIEVTSSIAQIGYEQHGDIADFIAEAERRVQALVDDDQTPRKIPLRTMAVKLSRDLLQRAPPPRKFMLREANTGRPIFLRGKVGLFAAAGGTGKSSAFGQLAISLATGLTWFGPGGWAPIGTMRVLLLAGEDDQEELERRLYFSAKDVGAISDELLDLVARHVVAIPLAGRGCALTVDDSFSQTTLLPETAFAVALREHVREETKQGRPYGMILIDPLSRFAGFDVEKDNAAATRWVQVVETFTAPDCGAPAVLAAHHTKKRNGNDREQDGHVVDLIRGASALKDGVRWAAVLEQQKRNKGAPDLLTLRIVKANGVPPQLMPLVLCRDEANEGALRLATPAEVATNEKLLEAVKTKQEMLDDVRAQVRAVMELGRAYSRKDLRQLTQRRQLSVNDAVNQMLTEGILEEPRRGVLRLNGQLDLANDSRDSHSPESIGSAVQLSGSAIPAPPPLSCFKQEGCRESSETQTASAEVPLSVVKDPEDQSGIGNRSREPLKER
jgi:hypothetical protein